MSLRVFPSYGFLLVTDRRPNAVRTLRSFFALCFHVEVAKKRCRCWRGHCGGRVGATFGLDKRQAALSHPVVAHHRFRNRSIFSRRTSASDQLAYLRSPLSLAVTAISNETDAKLAIIMKMLDRIPAKTRLIPRESGVRFSPNSAAHTKARVMKATANACMMKSTGCATVWT